MNKVQKILTARRYGIKRPLLTFNVARKVGLPFAAACALLEKESYGGDNVFGHDPTIFVGAGKVNKSKYEAYKAERKRTGKMQGVGPTQLTWWEFQDQADALGGCYKPRYNMEVGFRLLKSYYDRNKSWTEAGTRYNGAAAYGADLALKVGLWRSRFGYK